ncbi:MAG: hypothetical protein K2I22_11400 [Lachnospiraceae bacterium]|nr:hypothetical protein [Lachnospiraceae bacterium]
MNRKKMPLVLMLTAGAVTCIITFIMKYPIIWKLVALLSVLLIFYGLGTILKWVLDTFEKQNEKAALDEGEVIAKETEEGKEENSDKGNE